MEGRGFTFGSTFGEDKFFELATAEGFEGDLNGCEVAGKEAGDDCDSDRKLQCLCLTKPRLVDAARMIWAKQLIKIGAV